MIQAREKTKKNLKKVKEKEGENCFLSVCTIQAREKNQKFLKKVKEKEGENCQIYFI